jgi:hypothetical protein
MKAQQEQHARRYTSSSRSITETANGRNESDAREKARPIEEQRKAEITIVSRCSLTPSPPIKPPPDSTRPNSRRNARTQGRNRASTGRSSAGSKTPPEKRERKTQRTSRTRDEQHQHPTTNNNTDAHGWFDQSRASKSGGAWGFWKGWGRRRKEEEIGGGTRSISPSPFALLLQQSREAKVAVLFLCMQQISPSPFACRQPRVSTAQR